MNSQPLPVGTVTFLFTDIEGSTRLLQALGADYGPLLQRHNAIMRSAVEAHDGRVFGSEGDAVFAVFVNASSAVAAAADAQRALAAERWPGGTTVRVRMGIHTGEVGLVGDSYVGLDLHRVARIAAAGHGGQVLLSESAQALAGSNLPDGTGLRDMGARRLKDLLRPERIFQLVIPGLPADFPELRTLDATLNNLPTQLTSFVGRTREVAAARALLGRTRLLTLSGPGGTGKTRLSLQLAAEVADEFADGAFFVPLDSVTDPGLLASAIVGALGLAESSARPPEDRLLEHVRDRRLLLILDNFEQIIEAAPFVSELLRASPGSKVIVTSRAPLRVSGEQEYAVPPLGLPDPQAGLPAPETLSQYEGVALFIERAVAVRPDFRVTSDNAAAVVGICARLDGLPLAIELAAARIKLLPPDALLARLNQRLGVLSSGSRDLPARQQTLRGAIAWSFDLLEPGAQRLLVRASTFSGGMSLEEAEAVCGPQAELSMEVFDGLAGLVDQSLLRQVETTGNPRFRMLQTIRDFAMERLAESGEAGEIHRRHALAFMRLAEQAAPHFTGPDQRRWLDRLEAEIDNIRSAMAWAVESGSAEIGLRLAGAVWRMWQFRGYLAEGFERTMAVLALPGASESPAMRRLGLDAAAGLAYWRGEIETAKALYEEALALARSTGDRAVMAEELYNTSFVDMVTKEDVPHARTLAEEALALFRELGDRIGIARALWDLGNASYYGSDFHRSLELLQQSVDGWRPLNDQFGLGWALHTLGLTQFRLEDVEGARRSWTEMLRIFASAGDVSGIGTALSNFRSLAVADGDPVRALRLAGASAALVQRTGADLATVITEIEGRPGRERDMIDEAGAARAWAEGAAMSAADAIAYALETSDAPPDGAGVAATREQAAAATTAQPR